MHAMMAPSELILDTSPEHVNAQVEEACRLHDAAVAAYATGRADAAEALFRQALALFEHSEGVDHPDVAAVLGDLGAVYEERCEYTAAARCYERAATLVGACPDNGDADMAQLRLQTLSNWGRLLRRQGQYTQAAVVIRRALTFAEQRFGAESLQTAWALNELGMLGKYAGWFDEAEQCYYRALAVLEASLGTEHPHVRICRQNYEDVRHTAV